MAEYSKEDKLAFKEWFGLEGFSYCDEGGMNYEECAEACWKAALERERLNV